MTIKEKYKRFKIWQQNAFDWSFDKNELHRCVNCGNDFAGNYCPHCSQKADLGKVSWKSVIQSTAEVWGMHNRSLIYSLWQLIWRPGYFISDYINGKRQVSFPPVKMMVIMGVLSVLIDYLFATPGVTKRSVAVVEDNSQLVEQYFQWLESSPGWGWLSITCFFIIPTWCLFRYSPRNAKHSLPQCFFIQVFMSIQVLIVDDLADFFTDFIYIMIPLCYFYAYRQLFGYRLWGNFWRVLLMLVSSFLFAVVVLSIGELLTTKGEISYFNEFMDILCLLFFSLCPILVGLYISKITYKRRNKKE